MKKTGLSLQEEIMKNIIVILFAWLALAGCVHVGPNVQRVLPKMSPAGTEVAPDDSLQTQVPTEETMGLAQVPNFNHIVIIVLENQYLQDVIGSTQMPRLNALADKNILLTNYLAVAHPSLPNYLAMISGSTQGVLDNCTDCFMDKPNLADEIEASGRTWKAYFENMPSPCYVGNKKPYMQAFNPFIYFDSIRLDPSRCNQSIVPLNQLAIDLAAGQLPNFIFIMPNLCNSGHDCPPETADTWVADMVDTLVNSSLLGENSLIVVTFDEGVEQDTSTETHGEVATVLISPLAKPGYIDSTLYSHYSLLKTILTAWRLPLLGETVFPSVNVILDPWNSMIGSLAPSQGTHSP